MSHHLVLGRFTDAAVHGGGDAGDVELRPASYGSIHGFEPFLSGVPLLDRIRRSPQRYAGEFWDGLAAAGLLFRDVPVVSVILLEGNTSADPRTETAAVEPVGAEALMEAVSTARRGRYALEGPYVFGFPQVEVTLVHPLEIDGVEPAIGFCQAIAVNAASLSEAQARVADHAADNDGYVSTYGPVELAHALWVRDERIQLDTDIAWCSGKVFYGAANRSM